MTDGTIVGPVDGHVVERAYTDLRLASAVAMRYGDEQLAEAFEQTAEALETELKEAQEDQND